MSAPDPITEIRAYKSDVSPVSMLVYVTASGDMFAVDSLAPWAPGPHHSLDVVERDRQVIRSFLRLVDYRPPMACKLT